MKVFDEDRVDDDFTPAPDALTHPREGEGLGRGRERSRARLREREREGEGGRGVSNSPVKSSQARNGSPPHTHSHAPSAASLVPIFCPIDGILSAVRVCVLVRVCWYSSAWKREKKRSK